MQKAVEYICSLENDRSYLLTCNDRLTQRLQALGRDICEITDDDDTFTRLSSISVASATMSKRRKLDTESSDEGMGGGMLSPRVLRSELPADGPAVVDALRRQIADLQRELERERRISFEYTHTGVSQHRGSYSSSAAPFSSSTPRRGNLETIVEAIRCLEGDEKAETKPKPMESCRAAADSEELVVAAAEALQFIATGPRHASSSASASARWQRDLADIGNAWQGCR